MWMWLIVFLCLATFFALEHILYKRNAKVRNFRSSLLDMMKLRALEDVQAHQPWKWRVHAFNEVSYARLLFSRKPLKAESFYQDTTFLKPKAYPKRERTTMFLLMAHIAGQWGIAGFEPHEECAVNFISFIDEQFGDGTAFVVRLPNKDDDDSGVSEIQKHVDLAGLLSNLESGEVDLDAALIALNAARDELNQPKTED